MLLNTIFRQENVRNEVHIGLVGKYVQMEDAYISVVKALTHAALHCNLKLVIQVCDDLLLFLMA